MIAKTLFFKSYENQNLTNRIPSLTIANFWWASNYNVLPMTHLWKALLPPLHNLYNENVPTITPAFMSVTNSRYTKINMKNNNDLHGTQLERERSTPSTTVASF